MLTLTAKWRANSDQDMTNLWDFSLSIYLHVWTTQLSLAFLAFIKIAGEIKNCHELILKNARHNFKFDEQRLQGDFFGYASFSVYTSLLCNLW